MVLMGEVLCVQVYMYLLTWVSPSSPDSEDAEVTSSMQVLRHS